MYVKGVRLGSGSASLMPARSVFDQGANDFPSWSFPFQFEGKIVVINEAIYTRTYTTSRTVDSAGCIGQNVTHTHSLLPPRNKKIPSHNLKIKY